MPETLTTLDGEGFDSFIDEDVPSLVLFTLPDCPGCRILEPIVEGLAGAHRGSVRVAKLDIAENIDVARRYVMSAPSLVVFAAGEAEAFLVGARPAPEVERWLLDAIGAAR